MVNINGVSVRDTTDKSENPASWQKNFLNPSLLEDILFWDKTLKEVWIVVIFISEKTCFGVICLGHLITWLTLNSKNCKAQLFDRTYVKNKKYKKYVKCKPYYV